MAGVRVAYYLIHAMDSPGAFEEEDRRAARHFGEMAHEAGVQRIIYLGGLGDRRSALSSHLQSRQEVGEILRRCGMQTIEFRASIIIGSGSLSFEMIRALVERLPIMIMPRSVSVPAQPIAITDVVGYLLEGLDLTIEGNPIIEIGGADQVSYREIMREYACQRGLRRLMLVVPVLTPRLSSLWLGLVTPLYARVGRRMIDSIRHPTVVSDASALRMFRIRPQGMREAIATALRHEDQELTVTRWSDALSAAGPRRDWGGVRFGSRLVDSRVGADRCCPNVGFRAHSSHWGGLAGLWPQLVAAAWICRFAGGRCGHSPRTPRSRAAECRGYGRLVESRNLHPGSSITTCRRDEAPWARLVSLRGGGGRRRLDDSSDRHF